MLLEFPPIPPRESHLGAPDERGTYDVSPRQHQLTNCALVATCFFFEYQSTLGLSRATEDYFSKINQKNTQLRKMPDRASHSTGGGEPQMISLVHNFTNPFFQFHVLIALEPKKKMFWTKIVNNTLSTQPVSRAIMIADVILFPNVEWMPTISRSPNFGIKCSLG